MPPRRTPAGWRNLLEVRVRRLSNRKTWHERHQALTEIRDLAQDALEQMERERDA